MDIRFNLHEIVGLSAAGPVANQPHPPVEQDQPENAGVVQNYQPPQPPANVQNQNPQQQQQQQQNPEPPFQITQEQITQIVQAAMPILSVVFAAGFFSFIILILKASAKFPLLRIGLGVGFLFCLFVLYSFIFNFLFPLVNYCVITPAVFIVRLLWRTLYYGAHLLFTIVWYLPGLIWAWLGSIGLTLFLVSVLIFLFWYGRRRSRRDHQNQQKQALIPVEIPNHNRNSSKNETNGDSEEDIEEETTTTSSISAEESTDSDPNGHEEHEDDDPVNPKNPEDPDETPVESESDGTQTEFIDNKGGELHC